MHGKSLLSHRLGMQNANGLSHYSCVTEYHFTYSFPLFVLEWNFKIACEVATPVSDFYMPWGGGVTASGCIVYPLHNDR